MRDSGRLFRRRRKRGRARPRLVFAFAMLGVGLVGLPSFLRLAPLLVYNASTSAPIGLYLVRPVHTVARGDLLLVETPGDVQNLASERGYLPLSVPLVKRVAALPGDWVCAVGHTIAINGRAMIRQLGADPQGRPLPQWSGCRLLNEGEIFLLMDGVPDSFDSRYFGPVRDGTEIGRLVPLWLR